jgi:uncharacterized repeat protein (TIGR02543 family)
MLQRICSLTLVMMIACLAIPSAAFADAPHVFSAVSFYENDSPTDQVAAYQMESAPTPLTLFINLSPDFSNPGYSFNDWSTTPNAAAGSTNFADGATYDFQTSLSFYAQWTPDVYTLTYGAAGGSVSPLSVNYSVGSSALTLAIPTWDGHVFEGWNTEADYLGTSYAAGAVYTPTSSVTLYAQWTPDVYTVTYNPDGAVVSPISVAYTVGSSAVTLPTTSLSGYAFDGWNTLANGLGTSYAADSSYTPTSSVTLYAQWTPDIYTVFYNAEGGTVAPTLENYSFGSSALALLAPTLTGNTFDGWNSLANGLGISYAAGAIYTPISSVTLYAQWTPDVYMLNFNAEGGNVAPLFTNFTVGSTALALPLPTMLGNTFSGWNTLANGTGASYSAGASYTPISSATLYAQWTADVYTLTFNAEGGTGTAPSVNFTVGSSALTLPIPSLIGSVFNGWNSLANGSGSTYNAGSAYTPTASTTLYAEWTLIPGPLTDAIIFDLSGATGSIAPVTEIVGTSVVLPSGASLSKPGFTFLGWGTSATGAGTNYVGASSLVVNSSFTLYALWAVAQPVTINFAANGGVGLVTSLSGTSGASVTLPGGTGLSYVGHTFASWNTSADGSGSVFNVDGSFVLANSVTLYAQWDALLTAKSPDVLIGAVGSFASNSFALSANLKTQVHRLAELTRSEHYVALTLYGYTSDTGPARTQMVISDLRASAVATYLRQQLADLHVSGVRVISVGEGAVKAETSALYRRVEVFVSA